jgi:hypothetical protein
LADFFFDFQRGHLVWGQDRHDFFNHWGIFDGPFVNRSFVADTGDNGSVGSVDRMIFQSIIMDQVNYMLNALLGP